MDELTVFDQMIISVRPVFDFMLALWDSIPVEIRFVFSAFFGFAVGILALRTLIL